jgi:hypothetical protein
MATRMEFNRDDIRIVQFEGDMAEAVVSEPGWVAKLIPGRPNNRLNVFYHRETVPSEPEGERTLYKLVDGIYETEFSRDGGLHRIAFEVRCGKLGWVTSITLAKKASMDKIAQALTSRA